MNFQTLKNILFLILSASLIASILMLKIRTGELNEEKLINKNLALQIETQNESIKRWQLESVALQAKVDAANKEADAQFKKGESQAYSVMMQSLPASCTDMIKWMAQKAEEITGK